MQGVSFCHSSFVLSILGDLLEKGRIAWASNAYDDIPMPLFSNFLIKNFHYENYELEFDNLESLVTWYVTLEHRLEPPFLPFFSFLIAKEKEG